MDELIDSIQYDEYCKYYPVTCGEWEDIKFEYLMGRDDDPYLLDEETALERAKERVH